MDAVISAINVLNNQAIEITLDKGLISGVSKTDPKPGMPYVCPGGMIDTQVNGYLGLDYSDPNFNYESVYNICNALAKTGTLQHFATIVTRPHKTILRNIDYIMEARRSSATVRNALTGIHIEGNYISEKDGPRGAHDRKYVRKASIGELDQYLKHSDGLLKCITVGAEVEGILELIRYAVSCGIVVALGHTGATRAQIEAAVEAGARVATHLGNGNYQAIDRFDNPLWPLIRNERVTASVIADLCHVTPELLWIISRCKDSSKIVLVSDLAPCAGLPMGKLKWGKMKVEIVADGSVRLAGTPYLAGAGSSLFKDVFNFAKVAGMDMQTAFRLATENPVNTYYLDSARLQLGVGQSADFILFDAQGNLGSVYMQGTRLF